MSAGGLALVAVFAAAVVAAALEARALVKHDKFAIFLFATVWGLGTAAATLLTAPSFLHANLHGTSLLESIARFPADPSHRATYGPVSFLVLGAFSLPFDHRLEAIARINHALAAGAVLFASLLVGRISGRRSAALAACAAGLLFVPILRVAGSEDAHVTAAFFGAASFLFADIYGETKRSSALVAWVGAVVLMIHARQTFYPWALLSIAFVWVHPRALRDRRTLWGIAAIGLTLAARLHTTLGDESERISVAALPVLLTDGEIFGGLISRHPLADIRRFSLIHAPLLVIGLVALWRTGRRGWVLCASFATSLVVTLPFGFPGPGVELAFRLPAVLLGVAIAGVGADALARAAAARWRAPFLALLSAALVAVPLLSPGRSLLDWQSAEWREFLAVRRLAADLPPKVRVIHPPRHEPEPSYAPPIRALVEAGLDAKRAHPDPNPDRDTAFVFLLGIRCHGWSLLEDLEIADPSQLDREGFRRVFRAIEAPPPERSEERPLCVRARALGTPIGRAEHIESLPDDPPFVRYGPESVTVSFVRLAADQLEELEKP
ncbi:MAG: hypothetical protein HOV80_15365 [Polyangiaceae bacterium]|nr:hypothetical protein [Polyangiaceae bacterium]